MHTMRKVLRETMTDDRMPKAPRIISVMNSRLVHISKQLRGDEQ